MKQHRLKGFGALVILACTLCFVVPQITQAQTVPDASAVRSSAILTTSDVLSTFTLPGAAGGEYLDVYIPFTLGSLTNATVTVASNLNGNTGNLVASTAYYRNDDTSRTLTATGNYLWRVPLSAFGSGKFGGFIVKGTGTATSSAIAISVRQERR